MKIKITKMNSLTVTEMKIKNFSKKLNRIRNEIKSARIKIGIEI